jgi:hypothetical protein
MIARKTVSEVDVSCFSQYESHWSSGKVVQPVLLT